MNRIKRANRGKVLEQCLGHSQHYICVLNSIT